jgi:hypothetical protein
MDTATSHGPVRTNESAGDDAGRGRSERASKLKKGAIREAKRFVAMFLYLWVLFGLFVLHESIVLAQHEINYSLYGIAFVNALVLAKVMLIAEDLHLGRRLEDKPLIYPILYKSAAFTVVFICVHIAEKVIEGVLKGKTVLESLPVIGVGSLEHIVSAGVIVSFSLIPFFAFTEFRRVIGERELRALLFHERSTG